jgi:hypothetical protein
VADGNPRSRRRSNFSTATGFSQRNIREQISGDFFQIPFQRGDIAAFGQLQTRAVLEQRLAGHRRGWQAILPPATSVAVNLTIRQTEIVRNTRFFCILCFSVRLIYAKVGATKDCL